MKLFQAIVLCGCMCSAYSSQDISPNIHNHTSIISAVAILKYMPSAGKNIELPKVLKAIVYDYMHEYKLTNNIPNDAVSHMSDDGSVRVSALEDTVKVWHSTIAHTEHHSYPLWRVAQTLKISGQIESFGISPDGKKIITCSKDNQTVAWLLSASAQEEIIEKNVINHMG